MKIRVLQIVTRLAIRGVPRHVLNLAAGLDKQRYETLVLAGRSDPGEGSMLENAKSQGISIAEEPLLQRRVDPLVDARAFAAIYKLMRSRNFHVVHTHISKAGFLGRLAARCAGVPVIVHTYHGWVQELNTRNVAGRIFLRCEKLGARISDALIAVGDNVIGNAQENGVGKPSQYSVVPNGIDLESFAAKVPSAVGLVEGAPVIGTVGSLTPEKGFSVLLDAMPSVVERFPQATLYIIGDGPLRSALEQQGRERALAGAVRFVGGVDDIRPWLQSFDLFVQPSLHEGQGIALMEAMASGRPVIASRVGGIPEVVIDNETGILVPPGDPEALAASICALGADERRRRQLAAIGRARVRSQYPLERMIRGVEEIYETLLADKRISQ